MQVRPTLQQGSSGEAVKELQRALKRAGFDPGPIDGDFEPVTAAAVRSFQAARGLVVVGIVGPQTWRALFETFYVHNGHLHDSSGECVVLRGVNKMAVWDQDPTGRNWFPQIRSTGANVVRIVWLMDTSGEPAATVSNMDKVIQNCRDNNMIPMIELHDATMALGDPDTRGGWTKLGDIERFWTRADVTSVLKKHQRYLLLNIANEPGDDSITDDEFKDHKALSDAAKITYQVIEGFDWEDKDTGDSKGFVFPSIETISAIRNAAKRTIFRHIKELEKVGLLTRVRRRNLPSVLYIEEVSDIEANSYLARFVDKTKLVEKEKGEADNLTSAKNGSSHKAQEMPKMAVAYK